MSIESIEIETLVNWLLKAGYINRYDVGNLTDELSLNFGQVGSDD